METTTINSTTAVTNPWKPTRTILQTAVLGFIAFIIVCVILFRLCNKPRNYTNEHSVIEANKHTSLNRLGLNRQNSAQLLSSNEYNLNNNDFRDGLSGISKDETFQILGVLAQMPPNSQLEYLMLNQHKVPDIMKMMQFLFSSGINPLDLVKAGFAHEIVIAAVEDPILSQTLLLALQQFQQQQQFLHLNGSKDSSFAHISSVHSSPQSPQVNKPYTPHRSVPIPKRKDSNSFGQQTTKNSNSDQDRFQTARSDFSAAKLSTPCDNEARINNHENIRTDDTLSNSTKIRRKLSPQKPTVELPTFIGTEETHSEVGNSNLDDVNTPVSKATMVSTKSSRKTQSNQTRKLSNTEVESLFKPASGKFVREKCPNYIVELSASSSDEDEGGSFNSSFDAAKSVSSIVSDKRPAHLESITKPQVSLTGDVNKKLEQTEIEINKIRTLLQKKKELSTSKNAVVSGVTADNTKPSNTTTLNAVTSISTESLRSKQNGVATPIANVEQLEGKPSLGVNGQLHTSGGAQHPAEKLTLKSSVKAGGKTSDLAEKLKFYPFGKKSAPDTKSTNSAKLINSSLKSPGSGIRDRKTIEDEIEVINSKLPLLDVDLQAKMEEITKIDEEISNANTACVETENKVAEQKSLVEDLEKQLKIAKSLLSVKEKAASSAIGLRTIITSKRDIVKRDHTSIINNIANLKKDLVNKRLQLMALSDQDSLPKRKAEDTGSRLPKKFPKLNEEEDFLSLPSDQEFEDALIKKYQACILPPEQHISKTIKDNFLPETIVPLLLIDDHLVGADEVMKVSDLFSGFLNSEADLPIKLNFPYANNSSNNESDIEINSKGYSDFEASISSNFRAMSMINASKNLESQKMYKIDPQKKFCIFDLSGTCNDSNCGNQHFKDIEIEGEALIMEYIYFASSSLNSVEDLQLKVEYLKRMGKTTKEILNYLVNKKNESDLNLMTPESAEQSTFDDSLKENEDNLNIGIKELYRHPIMSLWAEKLISDVDPNKYQRYYEDTESTIDYAKRVELKPEDELAWIEYAISELPPTMATALSKGLTDLDCITRETFQQQSSNMNKALNILARGLKRNRNSVAIWGLYLEMILRRGKAEQVRNAFHQALGNEEKPDGLVRQIEEFPVNITPAVNETCQLYEELLDLIDCKDTENDLVYTNPLNKPVISKNFVNQKLKSNFFLWMNYYCLNCLIFKVETIKETNVDGMDIDDIEHVDMKKPKNLKLLFKAGLKNLNKADDSSFLLWNECLKYKSFKNNFLKETKSFLELRKISKDLVLDLNLALMEINKPVEFQLIKENIYRGDSFYGEVVPLKYSYFSTKLLDTVLPNLTKDKLFDLIQVLLKLYPDSLLIYIEAYGPPLGSKARAKSIFNEYIKYFPFNDIDM
ncbi:Zinc finger C3H1 domain-containing protein, partial [Clydaea vesicula]